MIQRIQSIFLLIAAVAFGLLFRFPFAASDKATGTLLEDRVFDLFDHPILLVLAGLGALLAVINIFMFRKRSLQMRLNIILIILNVFLIITAAVLFYNDASTMGTVEVQDRAGLYMPIIGLVLIILANVFIKKDDKLIRSSDRLR
jgi:hypothetical protein